MNKIILTILTLVFSINIASAQRKTPELDKQKVEEQKKADETFGGNDSWKDKMIYGGNIGGSLGNLSSFFMIQPIVGYKITDKFQAGLCPLYIYSSRTYQLTTGKNFTQSVNAFGPGVFGRYLINDNIFAHVEYLGLSYKIYDELSGLDISKFSNSAYVGGGYMPGGAGVYVVVLYDLLYNSSTSFYQSPFDIRIGFVF
ncbi:MAG: hypothetical protein ACEQSR_13565 [Candidatus Methylacidiphilales bacterium]